MVRFNDKPLITTLSDDDIMPITDMSDPSSDKKMNMKQLSEYVANLASHDVASAFKTLGTETVSSDSSAYKEILDRKRSAFDCSKFIAIGSPSISDDGILSHTSSNYRLNATNALTSILYANNYIKIRTKIHTPKANLNPSDVWLALFNLGDRVTGISCGGNYSNRNIYARLDGVDYFSGNNAWNYDTDYYFEFLINLQNKTITNTVYTIDNVIFSTSTKNYTSYTLQDNLEFIRSFDNDTIINTANSFADIKQFSITVDGIEIFNGNKTGIDQIKNDDYEIVGTSIITDDGIASGFSSNNYLHTNTSITPVNNLIIKSRIIYNTLGNSSPYPQAKVFCSTNYNGWRLLTNYGNTIQLAGSDLGGDVYLNIGTCADGDIIDVELTITKTNVTINAIHNGIKYTKTETKNIVFGTISELGLGCFYNGGTYYYTGSIDLNAFKIYVDGNLVYQPCLKIPYTQSKTGSKIVNASYRDRIFDLYEQTGKALYYTIDEENKNFTAPLSDIYGMITDNASLKNFTEEGKERFEAQNSYLTGDVLKEEQGLNQLKNMKTSTFDLSNFSVVGNPTITDDGIASGFSSSDYLRTNKSISSENNIIKIKGKFEVTDKSDNATCYLLYSRVNEIFGLYISNVGAMATVQGTTYINNVGANKYDISTPLYYEVIINNKNIRLILQQNNTIVSDTNGNVPNYVILNTIDIGYSFNAITNRKIDLSQFSITVDGVEVFNGNKTGLDVIKPDNYTKVGNPTITDDGIASGFSSSNYLINNVVVKPNNKLEMIFKFTTSSDITTEQYIAGGTFGDTAERFALSIKDNSFQIPFGSSAINNISRWGLIGTPVANAINFIKITWDGTVYNILHSLDESNWQTIRSIDSTVAIDFSSLWIGIKYQAPNYFFKGSIDINALKIYIDGNLVYQPTLRIPYTQSKTGSKIANIGSRYRVQDMYEQFGYAPYYTFEDDSFTLPKGEVYGLIGARSLKSHFRSGINYYDLYSDRELEQGGACTANVAVNLLKPYEDGNYVLSVPYSAKTATSFTPTSTGTWMAKGIAKSLD